MRSSASRAQAVYRETLSSVGKRAASVVTGTSRSLLSIDASTALKQHRSPSKRPSSSTFFLRRRQLSTISLALPPAFASSPRPFRLDRQLPSSIIALLASPYSTRHPAGPLPGSNNELDPRGVDYDLFELPPAETKAPPVRPRSKPKRAGKTLVELSTSQLSPAGALIRRLIREKEFRSAAQVLSEFRTLGTPFDEGLPEYLEAARWSIRHGDKQDAIHWLAASPSLHLQSNPNKPLRGFLKKQNDKNIVRWTKTFSLLLDTVGDDLKLLQTASLLAARKGYWSVLRTTLSHILRYGLSIPSTSATGSQSRHAWDYFVGLVQLADDFATPQNTSAETAVALSKLRALYAQGVKTLALSGRIADALFWIQSPLTSTTLSQAQQDILWLTPEVYHQVMTKVVEAGPQYSATASETESLIWEKSNPALLHRYPTLVSIQKELDAASSLREEAGEEVGKDSDEASCTGGLQLQFEELLEAGDLVEARDVLIRALRDSETMKQIAVGSGRQAGSIQTIRSSTLARFLDAVHDLGVVPMSSPLNESPELGAHSESDTRDLKAVDFLQPLREALGRHQICKGLWETAELKRLHQRGDFKGALQFFSGPDGFRTPAGGINDELISLATGGSLRVDRRPSHASRALDRPWPSRHAINIALSAAVNACIQDGDYARLNNVYRTWKANSLSADVSQSSTSSTQIDALSTDAMTHHAPAIDASRTLAKAPTKFRFNDLSSVFEYVMPLQFQAWPPAHPIDTYTFAPFLRAFAMRKGGTKAGKRWGGVDDALSVLRDMTHVFHVQPTSFAWSIVLKAMAIEGLARWETTQKLANAMGIRTAAAATSQQPGAESEAVKPPSLPSASLQTYAALLTALLRVRYRLPDNSTELLAPLLAIRDDMLSRIVAPEDMALRHELLQNALVEEDEESLLHRLDELIPYPEEFGRDCGHNHPDPNRRETWTLAELLGNRKAMSALGVIHEQEMAEVGM